MKTVIIFSPLGRSKPHWFFQKLKHAQGSCGALKSIKSLKLEYPYVKAIKNS